MQKNLFDQVIFHLSHLYYLLKNQKKNYIFVLIIKHWMWLWFEINIWFFWFKKHWTDFWKHDISWSLTSFIYSIEFIYVKKMKNTLHSEQDKNYLNNLWYFLIWKMNSICFSITLMICYINFLMYLSWHILMIFWFTQISCLNIKNMYDWFLNDCKKLIYNVTSENTNFMLLK